VPVLAGAAIAVGPAPSGLPTQAWRLFAVFVAVVLGMVLEPLPPGAVGLLGVAVAGALGLVGGTPAESARWALSGFSDATVWLIFGAFVLATGYERTGLGRRIALELVRRLGGRTLGLGYAIALADLALAPLTPSNTGRSGGVIYPIVRQLPELYGSAPGPTARRIGAYLMWTAFASSAVTSAMFVTALAPNPVALSLARQATGLDIGWTGWMLGFLPVGLPLLAVVPALAYAVYPPEIKASREVPAWAAAELARMGPTSRREWGMAALIGLALALWTVGAERVNATQTILIVVTLMVASGIVAWDDVLGNRQAWHMLVWFATVVAFADGLGRVGFVAWAGHAAGGALAGVPPRLIAPLLVCLFFFAHYFFASLTAHATALMPVFLATAVALPGVPARRIALLLCYSLGLMGVLDPYATGPAVVYYGSGFVSRRAFWSLGLLFGVLFLAALLVGVRGGT
jgi:anion transporter